MFQMIPTSLGCKSNHHPKPFWSLAVKVAGTPLYYWNLIGQYQVTKSHRNLRASVYDTALGFYEALLLNPAPADKEV